MPSRGTGTPSSPSDLLPCTPSLCHLFSQPGRQIMKFSIMLNWCSRNIEQIIKEQVDIDRLKNFTSIKVKKYDLKLIKGIK